MKTLYIIGGTMGVGKTTAKVYVEKTTGVTFKDVAGWRLVLGYAALYRNRGNQGHGAGKYLPFAEQLSWVQRIRKHPVLLGFT